MLSGPMTQDNFLKEIEYIFESLFADKKLPEEVKNQYIKFCSELPVDGPQVDMNMIVKHRLDVEAIEFYLRIKFRNNVLTKKIHAVLYLVEVRGEFFDEFHVEKNSLISGFFSLVFYTVRSIYKFFKGKIQVKFYGII